MDVREWLRRLGLEKYETTFRDNEIDDRVLPNLTAEDLKELGIGIVGHRRKLLDAIAVLRAEASLPAPVAGPPADTGNVVKDGAERRQVTVMFADLVGSTALSARMDPEDLREVISAYKTCVTDTVRRFGGFVAKYLGDGVLVYFGYPAAHEDDAERAVRAGLALIEAIATLPAPESLQVRIGAATGLVVVGDLVGSGEAQERSIVGETPNLAARLQSIADPNTFIISEATRKLIGNLFELRDLGSRELKGITGPARAFAVLRPRSVESRFEAMHAGGVTELVGRVEELELLLRRWAKAKTGEGQVVLVSGEAGIGKSRLSAALMDATAEEPRTLLRYFCSPQHTDSAFYPIIGHIERAAGFAHGDTPQTKLDKLDTLLSQTSSFGQDAALLADMLSLPNEGRYPALSFTPEQRRQKTLEALSGQVEALARSKPVLMMFEDAHWIDPTSLEAFGRMVDRAASLRLLLVITFRPDFQAPWVGEAHVTSLALNRLGYREIGHLIDRVTGKRPLSDDIRRDIIERTDGVPLFVEEMTKAVLEAGSELEAMQTAAAAPLPKMAVPASLHASLMARLDRLGPAKELAQFGSAIGREFSYALLAAVASKPEAELASSLDRLARAGLLFRKGAPPHATYLFKHALVQDAAYGTLLRQPRRDLHRRISTALIDRFPGIAETQPEILAHHCYEAGLIDKAIQWRIKAGQRALRRSAFKEAVRQFSSGLSNVQAAREETELENLVELHTGLGMALTATNGYASNEAGEAFAKARILCEKLNDTKALARVGYGQYLYHMMAGQVLKSEELARDILALGERLASPDLKALGLRTLGVSLFELGHLTQAEDSLEQAMSLIVAQTGKDVTKAGEAPVMIWTWLSFVFLYQGHFDQARAMSELAIKEARRSRSAHTQAFSIGFGAALSLETVETDFSSRGQGLLELANEQDLDLHRGIGAMFVSIAAMRRGDPSAATNFQEALGNYVDTGAQWALPMWLSYFSASLPDDHPEKADIIDQAFQAVSNMQERWGLPELFRQKGDVERARGDEAHAEQNYLEAIRVANEQSSMLHRLRASSSLARLWQRNGRADAARELLTPVLQWFAEQPEVPLISEARHLLGSL